MTLKERLIELDRKNGVPEEEIKARMLNAEFNSPGAGDEECTESEFAEAAAFSAILSSFPPEVADEIFNGNMRRSN